MPRLTPRPTPAPTAAKVEQPARRSLIGVRALSVRQPFAWLIVAGRKTIEYRSRPTHLRERVLIYAALARGDSLDEQITAIEYGLTIGEIDALPRGVLVGSVELFDCCRLHLSLDYGWFLREPIRFRRPIAIPVGRQPTPTFWFPFRLRPSR